MPRSVAELLPFIPPATTTNAGLATPEHIALLEEAASAGQFDELLASRSADRRAFAASAIWSARDSISTITAGRVSGVSGYGPALAEVGTSGPTLETGPEASWLFDGVNDYLATSVPLSALIGDGLTWYVEVDFVAYSATSAADVWHNTAIVADDAEYWGLHLKEIAGVPMLNGYIWSGSSAKIVSVPITYGQRTLATWWHDGSNMHLRVNGGPVQSVPAGAPDTLTNIVYMGLSGTAAAPLLSGRVYSAMVSPRLPSMEPQPGSYQPVTAAAAQAGYPIIRTSPDILVRLTEDLGVNGTFVRPANPQVGDRLEIVRQGGGAGLWSLSGGDTSDVLRARDDRIEYQCIAAPGTWVRVLPSGRDKRLVYRHDGATMPTLLLHGGYDGVDIVVHSGPVVVTGPQDLGTRFHCRLIQQNAANPISFVMSGAATPMLAGQPAITVGAGDELDVLVVQNVTGAAAVYRTLRHIPMLAAGAIVPAPGPMDFSETVGGRVFLSNEGGGGSFQDIPVTAIEPQFPIVVTEAVHLLATTEGVEDQRWLRAEGGSSIFRVQKNEAFSGAGRVWIIRNGTTTPKEIDIEDDAGSLNGATGGSKQVFLAGGVGRQVSVTIEANPGVAPTVQVSGDTTEVKPIDGPLIEPAPDVGNKTGAATFNFATAGVQRCTVTGIISSVAITNPPPANWAGMLTLVFVQDANGTRTISWGGAFRFIGGADASLATGNGAISIFTLMTWDGGTTWYVSEVGKGWAL